MKHIAFTLIALLALAGAAQAQVAAPTLNPTYDNLGANPATVPWSNSRIGISYGTGSTESQILVPPSTTFSSSQQALNGRAVGETFSGFVNYSGSQFLGVSGSVTEFGLAAQLGGWFGLGVSQVQASGGGNALTLIGLTAIAADVWYAGLLHSDDGAGATSDTFAVAYRSEMAHFEYIDSGAGVVVGEAMFGSVMAGFLYNLPETIAGVTDKSYRASVGVVDPKDWSFVLNYDKTDSDDGAGTFTRSSTIEVAAVVGF